MKANSFFFCVGRVFYLFSICMLSAIYLFCKHHCNLRLLTMNVHVGVKAFISLLLLTPLQKNSNLDIHFSEKLL